MPFAGYRLYSDGSPNGQGSYGYYWSSSPHSTNARMLVFNASLIYPQYSNNNRSYGSFVRCFRNAIVNPLISSVSYDPAPPTWTSGSVTVTVTLDQAGAALAGWAVVGNTFIKTYAANTTETVTFPSTL
jgi:hypothetical protein